MKQTKLALSAVMIVAVGLIGTNFVTGSEMTEQETFGANLDSSSVYGHITIIHSDPDGNILSYVQTDNLIANDGKDCMAEMIFGNTDTGCDATSNTSFNTIGLFNGESFPVTMNATSLTPVSASGLTLTDGGTGVTVSQNIAASGADYTDGAGSQTDIAKTFTALATQTVNGAALYNDSEDAVLAGQTFSSVTLNNLDTLAVTWTITLG